MSTGWHITSRNRANKICLGGLQPTDQDNFGAFEQLGEQLLHLVGQKPVYVAINELPRIEPVDFSRRLHVGIQQLRAVQIDLDEVELFADLPALSESVRLLFSHDRVLVGGPGLPEPRGQEPQVHAALRQAAGARKNAHSVSIEAFKDPRVLELCIQITRSACTKSLPVSRIMGVYTVAQARAISDYEHSRRRAG